MKHSNVAVGKKTLAESGAAILTGVSMADAVENVVKAVER